MPRGPPPLKKKLRQNQFYCVGCRKRVTVKADDICTKKYRNKKRGSVSALKGECHTCNAPLTKFIKDSAYQRLTDKYGKCRRS